jgi:hypothetical protein
LYSLFIPNGLSYYHRNLSPPSNTTHAPIIFIIPPSFLPASTTQLHTDSLSLHYLLLS